MSTAASTGAYGSPADARLPPGWSSGTTSCGRTYYIDHRTRSTTFERPADPAAPVIARNSSAAGGWSEAAAPLSPGWDAGTTSYGRAHYVGRRTQSATFERPADPAAPAIGRNTFVAGGWSGVEAPLAPGWGSDGTTPYGRVHHVFHLTQIATAWERPLNLAAPAVPRNSSTAAAAAAGRVEAPLPPGWSAQQPYSGETYNANPSPGSTTWDRPAPPAAPVFASGGGRVEAPLPPGWSALQTYSGETYHANHSTGSTTWDRPATPAAAPVAGTSRVARGGGLVEAPSPPPPGWSAQQPYSGETYNTNPSPGSTTWDRPAPPAALVFASGGGRVEAPLPPGWSAIPTYSGETYHANHSTGSTTWDRPATPAAPTVARTLPVASGGVRVEAPLSPGRSAEQTYLGGTYYTNRLTGSITWDRPTTPASPVFARSSRVASGGGRAQAPLPPGWSAEQTYLGGTYYTNRLTGSITWDRPTTPASPVFARSSRVASGGGRAQAPLPPGWPAPTMPSWPSYPNQNSGSIPSQTQANPSAPDIARNSSVAGGGGGVRAPPQAAQLLAGAGRRGAAQGLSASELAMLPAQMGNGSGPVDQCCVCMEDMTSTEIIVRLPGCQHTFHRDCIRSWLSRKACCPLDQSTVNVTGLFWLR